MTVPSASPHSAGFEQGEIKNEKSCSGHQYINVLAVILIAALLCFGLRSWHPGHSQTDEILYLTSSLNIIESGDWLVPIFNKCPRLQKPPLNYWLVACSYRLFGVGILQGRLPTMFAGVFSLILTYCLENILFRSPKSGLYGACALLGCYAFGKHAHWAITDVVLATLILGAFCGFAATLISKRRWGTPFAWACMGAAVIQ